jgi:hypothetical protein
MNIIEAIKSGKRFRRNGWYRWREESEIYQMIRADILADDWEVEQTVTITLDEFACAFGKAFDSFKKMELTMTDFYLKLTKELGL